MAKTLSLSSTASRVFHRFFSTSRFVSPSPIPSNLISRRSSPSSLFHLVGFVPAALTCFTTIRTRMDSSGGSYSQLKSGSNFRYRSSRPGCDYKHWAVFFSKKPGGKKAITKQQIIDCYVQILAKIVGSEEEAKKKMYKVFGREYYGFGCEIDEEISYKLYDIPDVVYVSPDAYTDPEYKDYGGELVVNGELVPRPPERQRRITPKYRSPPPLPGCDYKHWEVFFSKKPGGKNAITKQQIIDCYVQILAKIVGSEEEAKKKMYKVVFGDEFYGFGCEIDEEISYKLYDIPDVEYMSPDAYTDPEFKDYGGELVVNGELVPRPPERQRRITPESDYAPSFVYDGCDYEHWLIDLGPKPPAGENATKQQTIDCYVQTLANIVGSEEEAKRKIYKVSCEGKFCFGCEIDRKTFLKLYELPEVCIYADAYVDREYRDYGDELFVNGEVVPRPPERQRRIMELTRINNLTL